MTDTHRSAELGLTDEELIAALRGKDIEVEFDAATRIEELLAERRELFLQIEEKDKELSYWTNR
jgi:hypothetical protein